MQTTVERASTARHCHETHVEITESRYSACVLIDGATTLANAGIRGLQSWLIEC
jgi:hypothetical protein